MLNINTAISTKIDFLQIGVGSQITFGTNELKVENPKKLAGLLLAYDEHTFNKTALRANKKRFIRLKNPIRVNIVFLTCEVIEGTMTVYQETSKSDEQLELALYRVPF